MLIYGFHDRTPDNIWLGKPGWIIVPELVGGNGGNYQSPHETIVRLNNAYGSPGGTIPLPDGYQFFAQKVGQFVAGSTGCKRWIIGNETNASFEWPDSRPILPYLYGQCFAMCRSVIKAIQPDAEVIPAAPAPWNNSTAYPGNERGDWVKYWIDCLDEMRKLKQPPDALALHTYTHGADPHLVTDETRMDFPFGDRHYNFRAYRDFLDALPGEYRDLPVYITETNQVNPWADVNQGWVQAAYREINAWNTLIGTQKIHALCLYRWPRYDKWHIDGKMQVVADFQQALDKDYGLPDEPESPEPGGYPTLDEIRRVVRGEIDGTQVVVQVS